MKIYLSPSVQENNRGVGNYGTEEQRMNEIADVVQRELSNRNNIELKRNNKNMNSVQITNDSNGWKADYHCAFHSNAGGGKGCEVYHYVDGTDNLSVKIARRVYNKVVEISPNPGRGLKSGMALFEVNNNIKAVSFLIEIGFHDNAVDANFIVTQKEKIGIAIANGILEHLRIDRGINVDKVNGSENNNNESNNNTNAPNINYSIGSDVIFSKCYSASTDTDEKAISALNMKKNHGVITKIVNARNKYLLDKGLCWVNEVDITGIYNGGGTQSNSNNVEKYKVNSVYPNIRKGASLSSPVVRLAKKDEILEVIGIENGFLKLKDGTYLKQGFADKV